MRCLAKHPGARISSYAQLKAALTPFSSRGLTTAPLSARIAAGVVDAGIVVACTYTLNYWLTLAAIASNVPLGTIGVLHVLSDACLVIAYFCLSEGFAGRSAGKWVFGLRIAKTDGSRAGVGRAFARAAVLASIVCSAGLVRNWPEEPQFRVQTASLVSYVSWPTFPSSKVVSGDPYAALLLLALFLTARRENRFAGMHELSSGTRVVVAPVDSTTRKSRFVAQVPPNPIVGEELGPYIVPAPSLATLGSAVVGFDPRLRRRVWIHFPTAGVPVVDGSRRDIARPTRPRWLSGSRGSVSWDAYEFADGEPLCAVDGPQPWRVARSWLKELVGELVAGFKEGSLPALGLDRVWITANGRVKLLDWSVAPEGAEKVDAAAASSPPTFANVQQFLHAVALRSLEGSAWSRNADRRGAPHVALPLAARAAIDDLANGRAVTADDISGLSHRAFNGDPEIPRYKRLLLVAMLAAAPAFVLAQGMYLEGDAPLMAARQSRMSVVRSLFNLAERLDSGRLPDPDGKLEQAATLVLGAWLPTFPNGVAIDGLPEYFVRGARWAARGRAATPRPSPQQLDEALSRLGESPATRMVWRRQPLKGLPRTTTSGILGSWFSMRLRLFVSSSGIPALVLLSLVGGCMFLAALTTRRGLAIRLLRIAIVSEDGAPASRLVLARRALLMTAPAALALLGGSMLGWDMAVGYFPENGDVIEFSGFSGWGSVIVLLVTLAIYSVGAAHAIARPPRSVIDRLSGSVLVPE